MSTHSFDPAGTGFHHDHPVRQKYGLVDRMRHQDHGLAGELADAEKLLL